MGLQEIELKQTQFRDKKITEKDKDRSSMFHYLQAAGTDLYFSLKHLVCWERQWSILWSPTS